MTNFADCRPAQILLIEDSPSDVRLTEEALHEAKIANDLHVARDGVEAMAFLRREGDFAGASRPDLILLDLNLPKKNGREVLAEVKEDPLLATIPVIVLTTSREEEDVLRAYELHANSFIAKPIDLQEFMDVVRSIESYWLSIVRLPRSTAGEPPEGV